MNQFDVYSEGRTYLNNLLTIGIPVFEEEEGLSKTIFSIENLIEFRTEIIKVVIWDNHSQDDSEKVAIQFAARNPDLVLVGQNATNIGPVGNLVQVLKNSTSRFVWILGAGEELTSPTLEPLLDFLGEPRNSDVVMGTVKADSGSEVMRGARSNWEIHRVDPESDSCFVETISLSIVDRNLALTVLDANNAARRDMNYVWPHLEVALSATSAPTFKVDHPALVKVSENPSGWWYHGAKALDYYLNQVMLLKNHPREVEWVKIRLRDRREWHFAKFAFEIKLEGAGLKTTSLISALRAGIGAGPAIVALAISLCPKPLLRIAQTIFRKTQTK
jgi:glycosyltransferase involved in cell wall biosynthesis